MLFLLKGILIEQAADSEQCDSNEKLEEWTEGVLREMVESTSIFARANIGTFYELTIVDYQNLLGEFEKLGRQVHQPLLTQ